MRVIENWGVIADRNVGDVENGRNVLTSRIHSVVGNVVTTSSGSEYMLGTVHPEHEKQNPGVLIKLQEQYK